MTEILFSNNSNSPKYVWVEPVAYSIELDGHMQFRFVTNETSFAIEYDSDQQFTLRLDNSVSFTLYKRPLKEVGQHAEWTVDIDLMNGRPRDDSAQQGLP